jgi:hypothetical protein
MNDTTTPTQGDEQKIANLEQELKTAESQNQPTSPMMTPPMSTPEPTATMPPVPPVPVAPTPTPPFIPESSETPKQNPIIWIAVFILFLAILAAGGYFLIQSKILNLSQPTPTPAETLMPTPIETLTPAPQATGSATASPSASPSGSPSASPSASPASTRTPSATSTP